MIIYSLKSKEIQYTNKKIYVINNIDKDKLNELSTFPLASITKLFTFFTILLLQQDKLLDIDDKVNKYIQYKSEDFNEITIKQLLYHKAGIIRDLDFSLELKLSNHSNGNLTCTEIMNFHMKNKLKLLVSKINDFSYSNVGYLLLGVIIEKVTNLSYLEIFKKYIFKPLKLKHTSNFDIANIKLYNNNKLLSVKLLNITDNGGTCGALFSCMKDLIKFSKNIIKLLNNKSMKIIKENKYIFNSQEKNNFISHTGYYFGTKTYLNIKYDKSMNYIDMEFLFSTFTNF